MKTHEARLLELGEAYNRLAAKGQECQVKAYSLTEGVEGNAQVARSYIWRHLLEAPAFLSTTGPSPPARESALRCDHGVAPRLLCVNVGTACLSTVVRTSLLSCIFQKQSKTDSCPQPLSHIYGFLYIDHCVINTLPACGDAECFALSLFLIPSPRNENDTAVMHIMGERGVNCCTQDLSRFASSQQRLVRRPGPNPEVGGGCLGPVKYSTPQILRGAEVYPSW